jgi:hypothetical protein
MRPIRRPRACAGLVNAVNWERGRPSPDLALVAARLVDDGRAYGRRIDVRADTTIAGTVGCELTVLIRKLASGTTARGWQASSPAALPDMRRSCCAPGSALAWFPATEARALSARGRSKDDRLGE